MDFVQFQLLQQKIQQQSIQRTSKIQFQTECHTCQNQNQFKNNKKKIVMMSNYEKFFNYFLRQNYQIILQKISFLSKILMNLFLHFFKTIALCYYIPIEFAYLKLFVILETARHTLLFYKIWKLRMKNIYWVSLFYKYMLNHKDRMNMYFALIIVKLTAIGVVLGWHYYSVSIQDMPQATMDYSTCLKWENLSTQSQNYDRNNYEKCLLIIYCFCVSQLSFVSLNAKINYQNNKKIHCLLGSFYILCVIIGLFLTYTTQNRNNLQIFAFSNYLLYAYKSQIKSIKLKGVTNISFISMSSYQICKLTFGQFFTQLKETNGIICLFAFGYLVLILNIQIYQIEKQSLKDQYHQKDQQKIQQIRQIGIIKTLSEIKSRNLYNKKLQKIKQQVQEHSKQKQQCAVCFDQIDQNDILLNCGHVFHENCVQNWFIASKKGSCPICRAQLCPQQEYNERQTIFFE